MDSLNQKGRRGARGLACWAGPLERVLGQHRERERGEGGKGVRAGPDAGVGPRLETGFGLL